jgi:hypothetical protein
LVFISAINKIEFYNDVDLVLESIVDIKKGTFSDFRHVGDLLKGEDSIVSLFTQDNTSLIKVEFF